MSRGIVMETGNKHVIVLTPDGQFRKVQTTLKPQIGEEFTFSEQRRLQRPRKLYSFSIGAAAIVLLLFAPILVQHYAKHPDVVAYLTMDVNPSIELGINKDEEVEVLRPINVDGANVTKDLDFKGLPLQQVTEAIMDRISAGPYLNSGEGDVVITSVAVGDSILPAEEIDLTTHMDTAVRKSLAKTDKGRELEVEVTTLSAPKEVRDEAARAGVSSGKMAFYLMAKEQGYHISIGQLKKESIHQAAKPMGGVAAVMNDGSNIKANVGEKGVEIADAANNKQQAVQPSAPTPDPSSDVDQEALRENQKKQLQDLLKIEQEKRKERQQDHSHGPKDQDPKQNSPKSNDSNGIIPMSDDFKSDDSKGHSSRSDDSRNNGSKTGDSRGNSSRSDDAKSNGAKNDESKSNGSKSNDSRGSSSRSDDAKSNISMSNISRSNILKRDDSRSDDSKSSTSKSNDSKSNDSKNNTSKSNTSKSDGSEGNSPKSDGSKGVNSKNNDSKDDNTKSNVPKSGDSKSGDSKSSDSKSNDSKSNGPEVDSKANDSKNNSSKNHSNSADQQQGGVINISEDQHSPGNNNSSNGGAVHAPQKPNGGVMTGKPPVKSQPPAVSDHSGGSGKNNQSSSTGKGRDQGGNEEVKNASDGRHDGVHEGNGSDTGKTEESPQASDRDKDADHEREDEGSKNQGTSDKGADDNGKKHAENRKGR